MKNDLIETNIGECSPKDSFHLTNSDLEKTWWSVVGTDLFGNKIIECSGEYPKRTESPDKKVFRRKRLFEILI